MTDHTLTEDRAAELWDEHMPPQLDFRGWTIGDRRDILDTLRAAFDAGREHERTNPDDDRPWEPLNGPVRVGYEVRRDYFGTTTTAVVGRVDDDGAPWTAEGCSIGLPGVGTWYIRRPIQELPTTPRTVIVPADGHEYIEAVVSGVVWRTREAVLGLDGRWHGAWRVGSGRLAVESTSSDSITPDTWKVDGQ